jgi:hypothetical protein
MHLFQSLLLITFSALIVLGVSIQIKKLFDLNYLESTIASLSCFLISYHSVGVFFSNYLGFDLKKSLDIFTFLLVILSLVVLVNHRLQIWNSIRRKSYANYFLYVPILLVIIFYFINGLLFKPSSIDELAYHIPQSVGAFQEHRLYDFDGPLPWIKHYPQGAAVLWGYCISVLHSDYMARFPQILLLILTILSLLMILRKRSIGESISLTLIFSMLVMPVTYVLSTTNKADLGYCAFILCFVAFLYPSTEKNKQIKFIFSLIALCGAATFKIPVLAFIVYVIALIVFFINCFSNHNKKNLTVKKLFLDYCNESYIYFTEDKKRLVLPIFLVLVISTSFYVYLNNFKFLSNPFYPVNVVIGSTKIFDGPLNFSGVSGHSTFGDLQSFSKVRVWHAILYDIFSPLNEDSYGSAGYIFGAFFLAMSFFSLTLVGVRKFNSGDLWKISISLIFLLPLFLPSLYVPRYHFFMLILILILAADVFEHLDRNVFSRLMVFIFLLSMPSLIVITYVFKNKLKWVYSNSEVYDRGLGIQFKYPGLEGMGPSPQIVKYIKENAKKDDEIIVGANLLLGYLWNSNYNNKVSYRSDLSKLINEENSFFLINNPRFILVNRLTCDCEKLVRKGYKKVSINILDFYDGKDDLYELVDQRV